MLQLRQGLVLVSAAPCEDVGDVAARCPLPASACVLALVRSAFLPHGEVPPPLEELLAPLGHGVVALAASSVQVPERALFVDAFAFDPSSASTEPAFAHCVALPAYLRSCGFKLRVVPEPRAAPAVRSGVQQSTNEVLMVAPSCFASNAQAAEDNAFMASVAAEQQASVRASVLRQHAGLASVLLAAGVRLRLFGHTAAHGTPDALFPNNWFATCGARLSLFPMKCPNRRAERRDDLLRFLAARPGCAAAPLDLAGAEAGTPPAFLEGTGSLVLDHVGGVAYLARSERSDEGLAADWVSRAGFARLFAFDAADRDGRPIYHTNVLLSVGTGFAVVCAEAVAEAGRPALLRQLAADGREVVCITREQMGSFCGNVLELLDGQGLPVLAMSSAAHAAFTEEQRRRLLGVCARLLHAPMATIEAVGGGGVRCCLGELF